MRQSIRCRRQGKFYVCRERSALGGGLIERFFRFERYGNKAYEYGFADRANRLERAYMLDQIELSDGDVVVDCGANVGDLELYFKIKGVDVEYLGVEPSAEEFSCLERNVVNSRLLNKAFWKSNTELSFYLSNQAADSSIIEPSKYTEVTRIPAVRLDSIGIERIKLLKVEAEGAEPEVLLGSTAILDKIEYITVDASYERGVECESTLPEVVNFLTDRGFETVAFNQQRVSVLLRNRSYRFVG